MKLKKRKSTMQRLQELLDAKDLEIEKLRGELDKATKEARRHENLLVHVKGGWCVPSTDAEDIPGLPLPRFEVRWYPMYERDGEDNWSEYRVVYSLVYRHLDGHLVTFPFEETVIRGFSADQSEPWRGQGPFPYLSRNAAVMMHASAQMALQIWAVLPSGEMTCLSADTNWLAQMEKGINARRGPILDITSEGKLVSK